MKHIYTNINGWFNFMTLYSDMVQKYDGATFIEVGCWKGRSAAYMAVEIINSGKNIDFYCVDSWLGDRIGGVGKVDVYDEFFINIQPVINNIKIIKNFSDVASKQFEDQTLDFIFIDASHDYQSVKLDLESWFPKVKKGGTIAGHDYTTAAGVKKAVDEWFQCKGIPINTNHQNVWVAEI